MPLRIYFKNYDGRIQNTVVIENENLCLKDFLQNLFPNLFIKGELKEEYSQLKVLIKFLK